MWYVDYSLALIGFAAGVGFISLLRWLIDRRTAKQIAGDEDVCLRCNYKSAVMSSLVDDDI